MEFKSYGEYSGGAYACISNYYDGSYSYDNPTVDSCEFYLVEGATVSQHAIWPAPSSYTFTNNIVGTESQPFWTGVGTETNSLGTVVVTGNTFYVNWDAVQGTYYSETSGSSTVTITNNTIYCADTGAGIEIADGTSTTAGTTVADTITITGNSGDYDIILYNIDRTLDSDNEYVTEVILDEDVTYMYNKETDATALAESVTVVSYYDNGTLVTALITTDENGSAVAVIPIELTFAANDNASTDGVLVYDIVLSTYDGSVINRLTAAQFQFNLNVTDGAVSYTVDAADSMTLIEIDAADGSGDKIYEFNYNSETNVDETAQSITIGQVTFVGSGTFSFSAVSTYDDVQVHATTEENNIVNTYTPDGTTYMLIIDDEPSDTDTDDDAIIDNVTIDLAATTLTINVVFPNAVNEDDAASDAYMDMTVTVDGLKVTGVDEDDYTITLGSEDGKTQEAIDITGDTGSSDVTGYKGYKIELTDMVYAGYAYTVTFKGAGYRTYRTSIIPVSDSATVTVWNNAMDGDMIVVSSDGADSYSVSADDVTFLAGDICPNGVIDLYDLSAVVSYFGKIGLDRTAADETYAQYDLNRDGKIDSKDIAMVLVSWGF